MQTPEDRAEAAREEASEWIEFLEYFDIVFENSFKKFGYTKASALQIFTQSNYTAPIVRESGEDEKEPWQK